jgi:hypothetical protein
MKTEYAVAMATFAGIAIGGVAVQALQAQTKPRAYVVIGNRRNEPRALL